METLERVASPQRGVESREQASWSDRFRRRKRLRYRRHLRFWMPYILLLPATCLLAVFVVYPLANVFYYSLQSYNPVEPFLNRFVGLGNFRQILTQDPLFWHSLEVSLKWVIAEVVLQFLLGLALALILNSRFRFRGLARAIMFSPWAVSGVAVTALWSLMYNPFGGMFDTVLRDTGLSRTPVQWLADGHLVFSAVAISEVWRGVPFFAILLLAALQGIPEELYEAARVDGGASRQIFFKITLPLLRNVILLTTLLRAVWEFKDVDVIYTMTGGGPANATTTLPVYIVNQAITNHNFGYGAALSVVGFVILLVFAVLYLRLGHFGRDV